MEKRRPSVDDLEDILKNDEKSFDISPTGDVNIKDKERLPGKSRLILAYSSELGGQERWLRERIGEFQHRLKHVQRERRVMKKELEF